MPIVCTVLICSGLIFTAAGVFLIGLNQTAIR